MVLPRAEKKVALAEFKERLLAQEEAWAACRVAIENTLLKNPDESKDALMRIVDQFGEAHGFTDEQKQEAREDIEEYQEMRAAVVEMRNEHPDDVDLVRELTGLSFGSKTKFNISTGPLSIDIVTDSSTVDRIYNDTTDHVERTPYNAFATTADNGVNFSVFKDTREGSSKGTFTHELEHQKNKIFQRRFNRVTDRHHAQLLRNMYAGTEDREQKALYAAAMLRPQVLRALDSAKDEILAVVSEKGRSITDFAPRLKDRQAKMNAYDYLRGVRKWELDDDVWPEAKQKALVDEYDVTIDKGVAAYKSLEKFYERTELAALLSDKALEDWPKFAARVYREKLKDSTLKIAEVLALQRKKEVREKLTRRALLTGSAAAAGGLVAHEVLNMPAEARRIHENLENVSSIETENAVYRIAYTSELLDANPLIAEGSDGLILEAPDDRRRPEDFVSDQLAGSDGSYTGTKGEAWLAQAYGLDPDNLPPAYENIMHEALTKGMPLYILDPQTGLLRGGPDLSMAKDIAQTGAMVAGLALANSGFDDLRNPTRRRFFSGVGKSLAALPFMAPFAGQAAKWLYPYEPIADSLGHKAAQGLEAWNNKTAPWLQDESILKKNVYLAQKSETLARLLTEKLGRKPNLSLVIGKEHLGVEQYLKSSEQERMRILDGARGENGSDTGDITEITTGDGYLNSRVVEGERGF
jgi:hypothetical protein